MPPVAVAVAKSLALGSAEASRFQWEEPGPWESGAGEVSTHAPLDAPNSTTNFDLFTPPLLQCTDIAEHEATTTDHYTALSLEQEEIFIKNQKRISRIRSWETLGGGGSPGVGVAGIAGEGVASRRRRRWSPAT